MASPILRWFDHSHLPKHLQDEVYPFWVLATDLDSHLPDGAEKSTALRKLLEAKDAAVRAAIEGAE